MSEVISETSKLMELYVFAISLIGGALPETVDKVFGIALLLRGRLQRDLYLGVLLCFKLNAPGFQRGLGIMDALGIIFRELFVDGQCVVGLFLGFQREAGFHQRGVRVLGLGETRCEELK